MILFTKIIVNDANDKKPTIITNDYTEDNINNEETEEIINNKGIEEEKVALSNFY